MSEDVLAYVLVCDDDPGIRELLAVTLELDHQVVVAANGSEALAQLEANPEIEVAVLDVMMPELDGYETLRRIRSSPATADLAVIMLTARVSQADHDRAYDAGADAYLTKPFDPEDLEQLIAAVLELDVEERRLRRGEPA